MVNGIEEILDENTERTASDESQSSTEWVNFDCSERSISPRRISKMQDDSSDKRQMLTKRSSARRLQKSSSIGDQETSRDISDSKSSGLKKMSYDSVDAYGDLVEGEKTIQTKKSTSSQARRARRASTGLDMKEETFKEEEKDKKSSRPKSPKKKTTKSPSKRASSDKSKLGKASRSGGDSESVVLKKTSENVAPKKSSQKASKENFLNSETEKKPEGRSDKGKRSGLSKTLSSLDLKLSIHSHTSIGNGSGQRSLSRGRSLEYGPSKPQKRSSRSRSSGRKLDSGTEEQSEPTLQQTGLERGEGSSKLSDDVVDGKKQSRRSDSRGHALDLDSTKSKSRKQASRSKSFGGKLQLEADKETESVPTVRPTESEGREVSTKPPGEVPDRRRLLQRTLSNRNSMRDLMTMQTSARNLMAGPDKEKDSGKKDEDQESKRTKKDKEQDSDKKVDDVELKRSGKGNDQDDEKNAASSTFSEVKADKKPSLPRPHSLMYIHCGERGKTSDLRQFFGESRWENSSSRSLKTSHSAQDLTDLAWKDNKSANNDTWDMAPSIPLRRAVTRTDSSPSKPTRTSGSMSFDLSLSAHGSSNRGPPSSNREPSRSSHGPLKLQQGPLRF